MVQRYLPAAALALAATAVLSTSPAPAPAASARRDATREEANRALVLRFSEAAFIRHDLAAARTLLSPDYIQHNPRMASGREAFVAAYGAVLAAHPGMRAEIVRSAADGDLVWVHMRSTEGDGTTATAIVNIFRVRDGLIVEHWDVLQPVPPTAANGNTMF